MIPHSFVLQKTADGSDTLFSAEMDESYHSINGAVQESKHVFLEAGLHQIKSKTVRILEIGFGTGLNALLTWAESRKLGLTIFYETIEAYPVSMDIVDALNYHHLVSGMADDAFHLLHSAPWNASITLEENGFTLLKLQGDFTQMKFDRTYDLIYFDAFAPDKQPEMWSESLFSILFETLNEKGILVTYCAKGEIRRRMQRSGFQVERIPGPPGKREMLRAVKPKL